MIRRGELSQEHVGGRWLIPVGDMNRILNPSSEPRRDHQKPATPKDQRSKPDKKHPQGKLHQSAIPSQHSLSSRVPTTKKTRDLAGEVERLERKMKQIYDELRDLRSGLLNDQKRERIEELKSEKSRQGRNLKKL